MMNSNYRLALQWALVAGAYAFVAWLVIVDQSAMDRCQERMSFATCWDAGVR